MLSHKVASEGVLPSDGHIRTIRNLVEPSSGDELMKFLGLMNSLQGFLTTFRKLPDLYMTHSRAQDFPSDDGMDKS